MTKHSDSERVSHHRAAERLVDLAYALTMGGPLELELAGERVSVPVAREVVVQSSSASDGRHVTVELAVSWSVPATSATITGAAVSRRP